MELFYACPPENGIITLDGEQSGHCVRVLRHRVGDIINVIDGSGPLYECELTEADPREAVARVLRETKDFGSHPYHLTMAVCPTKNIDRYEWFVEKATEIGVDVIVPVFGERSERRTIKAGRLERLVISAAKQSLKGRVPQLKDPESVMDFISSPADQTLRLICYCDDDETLRTSITAALAASPERNICILIGPEGDFSPSEVQAAFSHGWKPVHLGSSRLRTETAAIAAVSVVYFAKGQTKSPLQDRSSST